MSIEHDLKKDGITVVNKLDTLISNRIAKNITDKLVETFPKMNFDSQKLFISLSRINMYTADMPNGMAEANYFYKNSSIYFNTHIETENLEEYAVHECIHHLQEIKNNHNKLLRMGVCTFDNLKPTGIGLNEAAVQLITSKVNGTHPDFVKYYGVSFKSSSPSYYPVECYILEQICYFIGENTVFESTFNSNDNFKNMFISLTSKRTYDAIINAVDKILKYETNIIKYNNILQKYDEHTKAVDRINNKIKLLKEKIALTFMRTQNLIVSSFFDNSFDRISSFEDIENFREKLEGFKPLVARCDGYFFFDNYYTEKLCALEHKYNILEHGGIETAPELTKVNKFLNLFRSLQQKFLFKNSLQ